MAKLKKVLKKREGEFSYYRNCWLFSVSLSAMLIGERKAKRTRSWLIPQPLARIGLAQQSKVLHFRGRFVACCGGIRANGFVLPKLMARRRNKGGCAAKGLRVYSFFKSQKQGQTFIPSILSNTLIG